MNIVSAKEIGSTVYFLKQIKKDVCPICCGKGEITLTKPISPDLKSPDAFAASFMEQVTNGLLDTMNGNGKNYTCPECKGKGTIKHVGQPKFEVSSGVIQSASVTMDGNKTSFVFEVVSGICTRKLTDDNTWLSREDAQKRCDFLNLERRLTPIECIQVPRNFAATIPCNEKLMRRLDEWRKFRKFETEIYVDKNLNMFDGYTSYLVYRMLGIMDVPVVIWPDGKRP